MDGMAPGTQSPQTPLTPQVLPARGSVPASGQCQLWSVPIGAAAELEYLLDPDELARVERFKVASARDTFTLSRAAQRLVLGHYLAIPLRDVRISRDCKLCGAEHGRPYVEGAPVDFSVSHTTGRLLIAVVSDGAVGVDIETVSPARAAEEMAGHVLGPAEQERFMCLPREARAEAFIRAWTRKEAAAKLTGHGLVASFRRLDVTGETVVASPPPDNWPVTPIYLRDVRAEPDRLIALATTVPIRELVQAGPLPIP